MSENDIDILAITETWLREDGNEFSIAGITFITSQGKMGEVEGLVSY